MSIVKRSAQEIRTRRGRVDLKRVKATTDEAIEAQIANDPETAPDQSSKTDFRRVYNPPVPDVKAIRGSLGLSQSAFANRFGFSLRTVQEWEQQRSAPDVPARILLKVIETDPSAVERALSLMAEHRHSAE
jgi:putative transcriptional regulator